MTIFSNLFKISFENSNTLFSKIISSDYILEQGYKLIEVDANLSSIIITLPIITDAFKTVGEILIKRIDDNSNNFVTINGTGGNYEDHGIVLYGLEITRIYASNSGIWRASIQ